jgi:hypothetical protein
MLRYYVFLSCQLSSAKNSDSAAEAITNYTKNLEIAIIEVINYISRSEFWDESFSEVARFLSHDLRDQCPLYFLNQVTDITAKRK